MVKGMKLFDDGSKHFKMYISDEFEEHHMSAAVYSVMLIHADRVREKTKVNRVFVRYADIMARFDYRRKEAHFIKAKMTR